jgi:hypothetical protein
MTDHDVAGVAPEMFAGYLMWCFSEGYGLPEDRPEDNWLLEPDERLHPDDVRLKAQLIALGRDLVAAIEPVVRADERRYTRTAAGVRRDAEALAAELRDERDAARAEVERLRDAYEARDIALSEVAALREQYVVEEFIDTDGYPSMRVVKGEHVGQNEWAANIRREVLADLRAKVESGWIPELDHEARIAVLALFEEADRG